MKIRHTWYSYKPKLLWNIASLLLLVALVACGGGNGDVQPTPTATPTAAPQATPTPTPQTQPRAPTPTSTPTAQPTPTPAPGVVPTPTVVAIQLEVLSPSEGIISEIGVARVLGTTQPGATVTVNNSQVSVDSQGRFTADMALQQGSNTIQVSATADDLTSSKSISIVYQPPASGMPFTIFYPLDGTEVSQSEILVMGGTNPDAIVGVNGEPVEVNAAGIFSTTVFLEDAVNFIEIAAADLEGNTRAETITVFLLP